MSKDSEPRGLVSRVEFVCRRGIGQGRVRPPPIPKPSKSSSELGLAESPTALRDMKGWRAPRRIVMATQNPNGTGTQEMRATLAGVAPGVEVVFVADATDLVKEAANADAIIGGDDVACDDRVLAAAKRVRWIAVMSAGVEACLGKPALEKPGITVTNMRAVAGPVMAEHTIALMFALSRSLQVSIGRQATGEGWNRNFAGSQPQALTGKTLLVVGLGGIGLEVAKRAHALGMKVIAHSQQLARRPRLRELRRACRRAADDDRGGRRGGGGIAAGARHHAISSTRRCSRA